MNTITDNPFASTPAATVKPLMNPLTMRQRDFSAVLARQANNKTEQLDETQAREAAADFVAAAFIEPLLKNLRSDSQAAPPFAPGPGEKQFRGLMDAQLARQITRCAHFPLVDRVAHNLLRKPPELREMPREMRMPTAAGLPHLGAGGTTE